MKVLYDGQSKNGQATIAFTSMEIEYIVVAHTTKEVVRM